MRTRIAHAHADSHGTALYLETGEYRHAAPTLSDSPLMSALTIFETAHESLIRHARVLTMKQLRSLGSPDVSHNFKLLAWAANVQSLEAGNTGLTLDTNDYMLPDGTVVIRHATNTENRVLLVDELTNAGALEGADKHDDWGFEGTQLPQFKQGFTHERITTSSYIPGDQYSQLGTTLRGCTLQPAPFKGSRHPSFEERFLMS